MAARPNLVRPIIIKKIKKKGLDSQIEVLVETEFDPLFQA